MRRAPLYLQHIGVIVPVDGHAEGIPDHDAPEAASQPVQGSGAEGGHSGGGGWLLGRGGGGKCVSPGRG